MQEVPKATVSSKSWFSPSKWISEMKKRSPIDAKKALDVALFAVAAYAIVNHGKDAADALASAVPSE